MLIIATCQFPVSGDLQANSQHIHKLMSEAAAQGASVVHFPETALPGYGPAHFETLDDYPWGLLHDHEMEIQALAATLNIWVILGTMSQLQRARADATKPKNTLLIISDKGEIQGRYDKQRLYNNEVKFYDPGHTPLVVEIHGHKCGFLICFDNCFPELYETYRKLGVSMLFHSLHNADNQGPSDIEALMLANLITRAADHQMCISASNSCSAYSPQAATFAKPDGSTSSAERHKPALILNPYPPLDLGWTYDNRP